MTPRRVVWVVEIDGVPHYASHYRQDALDELAIWHDLKPKPRVVRYEPARPKRKGGGIVDR
jgi:hypothetical protein